MCFSYCARVNLKRVPYLWLCEECRNYSSIPEIAYKAANSRINQVEEAVDIEADPSSKTNQVEQSMDNKDSMAQITALTITNQAVDNEDPVDQTAPSSRSDQAVNYKASIEIAPSSRTNQVEQVVPVVPHFHQYTRDKSSLESSCPVSPCSLGGETNLLNYFSVDEE